LSAAELLPTVCTFQRCTDCVDIASRSSARGHQKTLMWQKQAFVHTRMSRAYLSLARLSCLCLRCIWKVSNVDRWLTWKTHSELVVKISVLLM